MATTHGACAARKPRTFARVMRFRNSTCPAASAPCTWNTCFAMSKPIVVACSMDASFGGSSTPSPWHTDAVGGRPPHHPSQPSPIKGEGLYQHSCFYSRPLDGGGSGVGVMPAECIDSAKNRSANENVRHLSVHRGHSLEISNGH